MGRDPSSLSAPLHSPAPQGAARTHGPMHVPLTERVDVCRHGVARAGAALLVVSLDSPELCVRRLARLIAAGHASYSEVHYAIMRAYARDCDTGDERAFQQAETRISALLVAAVHRAELTA